MRTPAGSECRYYYEDFNRGRQTQECRLIKANRRSLPWTEDLCGKCKVPAILQANGSPLLRFELTAKKRFGLFKGLDLVVRCAEHDRILDNPELGCAACDQ